MPHPHHKLRDAITTELGVGSSLEAPRRLVFAKYSTENVHHLTQRRIGVNRIQQKRHQVFRTPGSPLQSPQRLGGLAIVPGAAHVVAAKPPPGMATAPTGATDAMPVAASSTAVRPHGSAGAWASRRWSTRSCPSATPTPSTPSASTWPSTSWAGSTTRDGRDSPSPPDNTITGQTNDVRCLW